MSNNIISIAPGKLIITGEHSVVYGEPALIGAIDLYTTCEIGVGGDGISVSYINFDQKKDYQVDELREYWREAGDVWALFNNSGDNSKLRIFQQNKHSVVKLCLGQIYDELGVCGGVNMSINSDIPVGSGLGSSASVAASIIGGLGKFFEVGWSREELNERVYGVEKIVHGNPSGGDNSTVVYGGLLEYRKIEGRPNLKKKEVKNRLDKIYLIQTGKPEESTGEMVKVVADILKRGKKKEVLSRMGDVSRKIIKSFLREIDLDLIKENQKLLKSIGVVGDRASELVIEIEKEGGAAKVCGAGGVRGGSGIMLVSIKDEDRIKYLVDKYKTFYYKVNIGVDGWQIK